MDHAEPDFATLGERAFNLRWATVAPGVIPLTAADPDLPVASVVPTAIASYLSKPHLCYGPPRGLPEFRQSVARHFMGQKSAAIDADRVIAANSAASAIALVARHLVKPGDEVVIQDPVDFLVAESARRAGATLRYWEPTAGRFTLDGLRAAVTERTRLISVCHPHNPLGSLWSQSEVSAIAAFAAARGIPLLSDEVWSDVVLDGAPFTSFAAASTNAWIVYGLSKGYGLAGLRIGAVVAPDAARAAEFAERQGFEHTIEGVSTVSQIAAIAALERAGAWRANFLEHCGHQRDLAISRLGGLRGVAVRSRPEATFVVFADVRATGIPEDELAARIESLARVKVVPGSPRWFGPGASGHIRLSLATTRPLLHEALSRIEVAWPRIIGGQSA